MSRSEFSVATKKAAKERAGENCENCGAVFSASNPPNFDHEIPDGLGGDNTIDNCRVLGGKCCHEEKTHKVDRPMMAKADRLYKKNNGLTKAKRKWPSRPFSTMNRRT